jgi:uncharacterized protein YegJ (DUF2314 family)
MSKQWNLESAVAMNAAHPDTFLIPSARERHNLRVGDYVKITFSSVDESTIPERMWVEVVKVGPGRRYAGRLDNEPFYLTGLQLHDIIAFKPDHVTSVTLREEMEASH